jgi:hypothetical protein
MDVLLVVLLVGAGGAGYLTAVWLSTDSKAIRFWAIWAVIGSIVLGIATILTTACGLAENRSELYYQRCEGSVPYIPLYAIPLLLAAPILRRFVPGTFLLVVGAFLVAAAIAIPLQLLSV